MVDEEKDNYQSIHNMVKLLYALEVEHRKKQKKKLEIIESEEWVGQLPPKHLERFKELKKKAGRMVVPEEDSDERKAINAIEKEIEDTEKLNMIDSLVEIPLSSETDKFNYIIKSAYNKVQSDFKNEIDLIGNLDDHSIVDERCGNIGIVSISGYNPHTRFGRTLKEFCNTGKCFMKGDFLALFLDPPSYCLQPTVKAHIEFLRRLREEDIKDIPEYKIIIEMS